jgi:serine/threonine-protein phosphatase PGAM5
MRLRPATLALTFVGLLFTSISSKIAHAEISAAPAARTIILVRHGNYPLDPPNMGLSALGVAQAKLAAGRLDAMPGKFDMIYASPMTRASETARVIQAEMENVPVQTLAELAECTPPFREKGVAAGKPDEAFLRCAATLDSLFKQRFVPAIGADRRELFVCHGNVTRYLVTRALGVDPEAWLGMSVAHASLTVIRVEPDGQLKVLSVGDVGHIPPNLQTGTVGMTEKTLTVPK